MNHKILKVFSLLLALTLLVVSSGISAVAADIQLPENSDISKLGIKVESDAETVTVSLFAKEAMYFYAIYGQWDCPEGLSLTSITANDKFAKFADAEEGNYANVETGEVGYMDFTTEAVAKDEVMMTATYKVLEYGTYSISFTSTYFHEQANNAVMKETKFEVDVKVQRPIKVTYKGAALENAFSVEDDTVIVTHSVACKLGYWDETAGKYVALTAHHVVGNTYSFTVPAGVTEVLLVVKGDATGDGKLLAGDSSRIKAAVLGKTTLTAEALFAAEVTGDGKLLAGDASRLTAAILGKTTIAW